MITLNNSHWSCQDVAKFHVSTRCWSRKIAWKMAKKTKKLIKKGVEVLS